MPVHLTIETTKRLIRATITGASNLSAAEFNDFLDAVTSHPGFRPGFDLLYDRRAVAEPSDPAFVRVALGAIETRAEVLGGGRWAVVIGAGPALEMVRMTALLTERSGVDARPFVMPRDALEWLGQEAGNLTSI